MQKIDIIAILILLWVALLAAFLIRTFTADAEEIMLSWDMPEQTIDGVKIFQKTAKDGDIYDYFNPVAVVQSPATSAVLDVPGEPDAVLKYLWVARAYRGDIESIDSNEVNYKVVNIPPAIPHSLTASYADDTVTLAWQQPVDGHPIEKWTVFYRTDPSDEYTQLGNVTDENNLKLTSDISGIAPAGQKTEISFVVVAYRYSGVFSADSQEVKLTIDREEVSPIQNLKIEIEIPL